MLKTVIVYTGIGIGVFLGLKSSLKDISVLLKSRGEKQNGEPGSEDAKTMSDAIKRECESTESMDVLDLEEEKS